MRRFLSNYFDHLLVFVGGFSGVLHRVSDSECVFREHNTDMDRVWSAVDLRSLLLPLPLAAKFWLRAGVGRRQLPSKSTQHYKTGKQ